MNPSDVSNRALLEPARAIEPASAACDARAWYLYLIECDAGAGRRTLYAGISPDVDRRYAAHAAGRGARYTRANPPLRLVGARAYADRGEAARAEARIRRLPAARKIAFLSEAA